MMAVFCCSTSRQLAQLLADARGRMIAPRALCCVAFVTAFPLTAVAVSQTNSLFRAVSISRQFSGYAASQLLSPAMCVFAEHVKREWLKRLDLSDKWRDPIILLVTEREGEPPSEPRRDSARQEPRPPGYAPNTPSLSLQVFVTDLHLKYQVRAVIPPSVDESQLAGCIIEALCLEFANRTRPTSPAAEFRATPVPLWIIRGLTQSIVGRPDVLLAAARRSVAAGRHATAAAVLDASMPPKDPAEALLFDANAWLMLESLLELPAGSAKLQQLLLSRDATKVFARVFAEFKDDAMREKWWSLELSRRTAANVAEQISPQQTSRILDEILITRLTQEDGEIRELPLAQLPLYFHRQWMRDVLRTKLTRLDALRSQSHPLQRPVLDAYRDAVLQLQQQRLARFKRSLDHAERLNSETRSDVQQISEVLDQAELAHVTPSAAAGFQGYFRILEQLQSAEQNRRNPMSDYLDKFDQP
jgi:hypothetical protein